jgi:hypothetical protein
MGFTVPSIYTHEVKVTPYDNPEVMRSPVTPLPVPIRELLDFDG